MTFHMLLLFLLVTFSSLKELLAFSKSQNPDKPIQDFSLCYDSLLISLVERCLSRSCLVDGKSGFQFLSVLTSSKSASFLLKERACWVSWCLLLKVSKLINVLKAHLLLKLMRFTVLPIKCHATYFVSFSDRFRFGSVFGIYSVLFGVKSYQIIMN